MSTKELVASSHVCSSWRATLQGYPTLWSRVKFVAKATRRQHGAVEAGEWNYSSRRSRLNRLNALLPRSGSSLISLRLVLDAFGVSKVPDKSTVDLIIGNFSLPVLRSLSVKDEEVDSVWSRNMVRSRVLSFTQIKFPALERLVLSTGSKSEHNAA
ncbi:hypothetical protein EXIGLDRAFT_760623 [Exidia glandulosa HHB12029]|uniref:F-box domain-containing protein n=1 Tax=Exidia glandulosa HHB12029 TaxID=1314781 RepID=A0A165P6I1_EXIGL|nr:hypothetical protein EXIGLDRAFT_760623 [Exidia glandulosa HHB12029]